MKNKEHIIQGIIIECLKCKGDSHFDSLTTDCCDRELTYLEKQFISNKRIDYRNGRWYNK